MIQVGYIQLGEQGLYIFYKMYYKSVCLCACYTSACTAVLWGGGCGCKV